MSVSGLFALRYPPPIPCIALLSCLCSLSGSLRGGTFLDNAGISPLAGYPDTFLLHKETFGPPKFPSYPREYMPCSQTPVVGRTLAMTHTALLHSELGTSSAFTQQFRAYPIDHNNANDDEYNNGNALSQPSPRHHQNCYNTGLKVQKRCVF